MENLVEKAKIEKLLGMMTKFNNNRGLTLLEVLIALTLVGILFASVDFSITSERDDIEDFMNGLERAVRFSTSEAILRNSIVRIHFELDKSPQEYRVEYGPGGDFVLPLFKDLGDNNRLSLIDQEKRDKILENVDKEFNLIQEYQSGPTKINHNVRVIGIATELREGIILDGKGDIFFYPSGERDSSFISASTSQEVITLKLDPFSFATSRNYQTMTSRSDEGIVQEQEDILKEEYANWLRN